MRTKKAAHGLTQVELRISLCARAAKEDLMEVLTRIDGLVENANTGSESDQASVLSEMVQIRNLVGRLLKDAAKGAR